MLREELGSLPSGSGVSWLRLQVLNWDGRDTTDLHPSAFLYAGSTTTMYHNREMSILTITALRCSAIVLRPRLSTEYYTPPAAAPQWLEEL